jgi:hypothetical protein
MRLCPTFKTIALLCLAIGAAGLLTTCSPPAPSAPTPIVITVPVPVTVVTSPTPPQVTVQPTVVSAVPSVTPTAPPVKSTTPTVPKVTVPVVITPVALTPPQIADKQTVPAITVMVTVKFATKTPTMTPPKVTVKPTMTPTRTPTPTPIPTRTLPPEDCLPYSPAKLSIVNEGAQGWLLTDSSSRMLLLDDQTDAQKALALAKRHTTHCFIGRDNKRSNRRDYIVEYWKGNSGQTTTIASEDCIPYNRANLKIVNEGANGWLLTDGSSRMVMLDDQQDAERALTMAKGYGQQCFIGRDNQRANRKDYIVTYWK